MNVNDRIWPSEAIYVCKVAWIEWDYDSKKNQEVNFPAICFARYAECHAGHVLLFGLAGLDTVRDDCAWIHVLEVIHVMFMIIWVVVSNHVFSCTPIVAEDIQFDKYFSNGWFNCQPVIRSPLIIKLPSYIEIIISHYKGPYKPSIVMESNKGFFSWLIWGLLFFPSTEKQLLRPER